MIGEICWTGIRPPCGRTGLAKAFIVAAPHSASGKTVLTVGLIRALKNRGLRVASAKIGPDYIDPHFHEHASARPCPNLDLWAMGADGCAAILQDLAIDTDIVVIEGVMGLFDGPQGAAGSTADLAEALDLPVILAIDTGHLAQSIAAIAHGYTNFRPQVKIAGLILNRVKSDRHVAILTENLGPFQILGKVRHNDSLVLPSRHLGLVQAQEIQSLESTIETIASTVTRETELDLIVELGRPIANHDATSPLPPLGQHMAIARDAAFSFVYPHLLSGWRSLGAEVWFFSPLANEAPTKNADAVFLPGGYPELHAEKLAGNHHFLESLRNTKAMVYGECGGYMVLGQELVDANNHVHQMAGLLPVSTSFARRKLHLGYRQLKPFNGPWQSPLRGHEFHYSTEMVRDRAAPLFNARDAAGNDLGAIGARVGNVMGSYAHVIAAAP